VSLGRRNKFSLTGGKTFSAEEGKCSLRRKRIFSLKGGDTPFSGEGGVLLSSLCEEGNDFPEIKGDVSLGGGKILPQRRENCERRRNFPSPGEIALRKEDKMFTRKDGFYSLQRREDIFLRGEKQLSKKGRLCPSEKTI
jgi:hypothetical protein